MSYSSHPGPYSAAPYDEDNSTTYAYTYSAGPEAWLYSEFDYSLHEVGQHMMSTSPVSLPMYETAQPMVSEFPASHFPSPAQSSFAVPTRSQTMAHPATTAAVAATAPGGFDFGTTHFPGHGLPNLSVLVDSEAPPGLDDTPSTSAADVNSVSAISPQDLRSPDQDHIPPTGTYSPSNTRRSFPVNKIAPLQEWFDRNRGDPYPSRDIKTALAQRTGLAFKQVNHWFINARKRQLPRVADSGMLHTPLTASPNPSTVSSTQEGRQYQASFHGPFGGTSPAPGSTGYQSRQPWLSPGPAMPGTGYSGTNTPNSNSSFHPSHSTGYNYVLSSNSASMPHINAAQATPRTAPGPVRSVSAHSVPRASPFAEPLPTSSNPRRVRRSSRVRTAQFEEQRPRRPSDCGSEEGQNDRRPGRRAGDIFQCTFPNCGKSFSSKTWKRHEETKHLPRFQWTCMCKGFIVPAPPSSQIAPNPHSNPFVQQLAPYAPRTMCAFCQKRDPDRDTHPQECPHRIADCLSRPEPERTFARKDHLFQHLRNFHRMAPPDGEFGAQWKTRVDHAGRTWPCGFCGERLGSWERRARHLRGHFREGCRIESDWNEQRARPGHGLAL